MTKSFRLHLACFLGLCALGLHVARAQEKTLIVSGVPLVLQDVSTNAQVYYSAMRFNRASHVGNAAVMRRYTGSTELSGAVVLYVESWTGTSGLLKPDAMDGAKPYFDLANSLSSNSLAAGQSTAPRTLTLGFSSGSPKLVTRIFA